MSKFTDVARTSMALSAAAAEEASRQGRREADIDHLLRALTISDQPAGQVLRGLGISIDAARDAVEAQHGGQLASLGVAVEMPEAGRITAHETGGYDLTARARRIFERSAGKRKRGDAAAVLRELVAEPSGLIDELLRRVGTTPDEVLARLDEAERIPDHEARQGAEPGRPAGSSRTFVPAPIEDVWALLADPERMPEWDGGLGGVDRDTTAPPQPGDTWAVRWAEQRPDGKPMRVKPGFEVQRVELLAADAGERIAWRFSYPRAARANSRRVEIVLEPAAGGTQLDISLAWERDPARRRRPPLAWVMRPLYRYAVWMQLGHIGTGISRALR